MKLSTLLIGSAAFVAAFGALEAEASGTPGLRGCPIVPIKVICPPDTYKAMRQNAFNNNSNRNFMTIEADVLA